MSSQGYVKDIYPEAAGDAVVITVDGEVRREPLGGAAAEGRWDWLDEKDYQLGSLGPDAVILTPRHDPVITDSSSGHRWATALVQGLGLYSRPVWGEAVVILGSVNGHITGLSTRQADALDTAMEQLQELDRLGLPLRLSETQEDRLREAFGVTVPVPTSEPHDEDSTLRNQQEPRKLWPWLVVALLLIPLAAAVGYLAGGSLAQAPDEETQARVAEIDDRESELDDREEDLEAREQAVSARESEVEDEQANLTETEEDLDDREEDLDTRETELDERSEALDEREDQAPDVEDLEEREQAIEDRESDLDDRAAELDDREEQLDQREDDQDADDQNQ
ncbi:hypothetical protein [Nesterenkonia marinintestina]|uniref:hypothetical protein n=1 Tax=Nesterenkonia marinintestina TaxID=2979865 RepID=UPI0021C23F81|nr:hypothetical protein [Nesterenkonia sp. GX14115]